MDPQKTHRLVELRKRRDELKAMLDEVVKEEDALSLALAETFAEEAVQSISLKALGATLYRHRTLQASLVPDSDEGERTYARAYEALVNAGLSWMIKPRVMPQTLTAWVKENEKSGHDLPPGLAEVISTYEEYRIRVQLNGAKDSAS